MLLSLSAPLLIAGLAALVLHFPLLTLALYKLFLLRPKAWLAVLLNVLLVVLVVVGPAAFLVWFYASGRNALVRERYAVRPAPWDKPAENGGENGEDKRDD